METPITNIQIKQNKFSFLTLMDISEGNKFEDKVSESGAIKVTGHSNEVNGVHKIKEITSNTIDEGGTNAKKAIRITVKTKVPGKKNYVANGKMKPTTKHDQSKYPTPEDFMDTIEKNPVPFLAGIITVTLLVILFSKNQ